MFYTKSSNLLATVPTLSIQLTEHRSERTVLSLELKFEKYNLVIPDKLGYMSFDKEGAKLLFLISSAPFIRYTGINKVFLREVMI